MAPPRVASECHGEGVGRRCRAEGVDHKSMMVGASHQQSVVASAKLGPGNPWQHVLPCIGLYRARVVFLFGLN